MVKVSQSSIRSSSHQIDERLVRQYFHLHIVEVEADTRTVDITVWSYITTGDGLDGDKFESIIKICPMAVGELYIA
jgi:hypothetical protein